MVDFVDHDFIGRYPAVYFAEMLTYRANTVRERCYMIPEGPVSRVLVDRPDPETVLADIPAEPVAAFGDRVGLVRAEVQTGELLAGESFEFTVYWTPLSGFPGLPHQAIFMLENAEEDRVWQESNLLGHDLYPQEQWRAGEVLLEKHRIYLPDPVDPGAYDLLVRVREHGESRSLACDRPADEANPRDHRLARITVGTPDDPSTRGRLPAILSLLRP
jgi:hypothetical protein